MSEPEETTRTRNRKPCPFIVQEVVALSIIEGEEQKEVDAPIDLQLQPKDSAEARKLVEAMVLEQAETTEPNGSRRFRVVQVKDEFSLKVEVSRKATLA